MKGIYTSYACHNCRKGAGEHCIDCKRVKSDDGRIRRNAHIGDESIVVDGNMAAMPTQHRLDQPEPVEEVLRKFVYALTDMTALEALLLHHIAKGGTTENFAAFIADKLPEFAKAAVASRQSAHSRWLGVLRKFAPLDALRSWKRRRGAT